MPASHFQLRLMPPVSGFAENAARCFLTMLPHVERRCVYLYQNAHYVAINIVLFNIHTSCTIFNCCINSVLQVCCLWQSPWKCWWLRGAKCQQWNDWHMQLKMRVRKCLLLDFGWFHANSIRLMMAMHFARHPTDKVKCNLLRMRTVSLGGSVAIVRKEKV